MITSKTNAKIKHIKKLLSSGKYRDEQGLFVAEGERLVHEIPAGTEADYFVSGDAERIAFEKNISCRCGENHSAGSSGICCETVSPDIFKSLSDTVNPQGVLAVVKKPEYKLEEIIDPADETALVVLLDDIRDPGNMGTIIRTAEAAGVKGIVMSPDCVDVFNPKVVRSTMGSIFRVPFVTADLKDAIGLLKQAGYGVYGTSLASSVDYKEAAFGKKNALITGNEANGIKEEILSLTTANIKIPMKGKVESLNAAISLAIVLFHLA